MSDLNAAIAKLRDAWAEANSGTRVDDAAADLMRAIPEGAVLVAITRDDSKHSILRRAYDALEAQT